MDRMAVLNPNGSTAEILQPPAVYEYDEEPAEAPAEEPVKEVPEEVPAEEPAAETAEEGTERGDRHDDFALHDVIHGQYQAQRRRNDADSHERLQVCLQSLPGIYGLAEHTPFLF
jgi:hypothetical protein